MRAYYCNRCSLKNIEARESHVYEDKIPSVIIKNKKETIMDKKQVEADLAEKRKN